MEIIYKTQVIPKTEAIIDLYNFSGYFPIDDKDDIERIQKMHNNANILVTAWSNNKLIGMARSISDFCYCCYLSDLCVRNEYKRKGIGKELIKLTKREAGNECKLILQSSPNAMDFYKNIGMENIDSAFIIQRSY